MLNQGFLTRLLLRLVAVIVVVLSVLRVSDAGAHELCGSEVEKHRPRHSGPTVTPFSLRSFVKHAIIPLLQEGDREEYATIEIDEAQSAVIVSSQDGRYVYYLTQDSTAIYPTKGMPEISITKNGATSEATFLVGGDLIRAQNIIRSSWGSDRYLCSTQTPPDRLGKAAVLNLFQWEILEQALEMENWEQAHEHFKRAIVAPVAAGKTLLSAAFAREWNRRRIEKGISTKRVKVIFVIEDKVVLTDAISTFKTELGFEDIARCFEQKHRGPLTTDHDMIAITRTGFVNRLEEIKTLMTSDPEQDWVVIFDEGHHTGKADGQFDDIKSSLDSIASDRIRMLFLSATLWHSDTKMIRDDLKGFVAAGFLEPGELALLRAGRNQVELCRISHLRGIMEGYFPAIETLHLVRDPKGAVEERFFTVHGIEEALESDDESEYRPLLETLYRRIKESTVKGVPDRGLFYVPSRLHADKFEALLQKIFIENGDTSSLVFAYHGEVTARKTIYQSFRDDEPISKYLFIVDLLGEGANTQNANLVAFMARYGDTANSYRKAKQNEGRNGRWSYRKPGFRGIDFVGFSDFIFEGLDAISVERLRPRGKNPIVRRVFLNGKPIDATEFEATYYERFPTRENFILRFPFYDDAVFHSGALKVFQIECPSFGVNSVSESEQLKALFHAFLARIPDDRQKKQVMETLDKQAWPDSIMSQARQGQESALRRIFSMYYAIVALQQLSPAGSTIDLTKIHTPEGCYQFIKSIMPEFREPLRDVGMKRTFADLQRGAMGALETGAARVGITNFRREFGAKNFLVQLSNSKRLTNIKGTKAWRERIADDKVWLWTGNEGRVDPEDIEESRFRQGSRPPHREPFQRIYRALLVLAELANEADPELKIDLNKIHEREECERLIRFLSSEAAPPDISTAELTGEQLKQFMESGCTPLINSAPQYGIRVFSLDFGLSETLANWAERLSLSPNATRKQKNALTKLASHWRSGDSPFDASAGGRIRRSLSVATGAYGALHELGLIVKEMYPTEPFEMKDLHTLSGVAALRDLALVGYVIPPLSADEAPGTQWFAAKNPVGEVLVNVSARFGVSVLARNQGLQKLVTALSTKVVGEGKPVSQAIAAIQSEILWQWKPGDGSTVITGEPASLTRLYRALYVLYREWNERHPDERLDLTKVTEVETLYRYLDLLTFGFSLPVIATEQLETFRDSNAGAYGAFLANVGRFEIGSVTRDYAEYWVRVAKRLPPSKKRDDLVAALSDKTLWGWSGTDTAQLVGKEYYLPSTRKMMRAILAIAVLWNESATRGKIDLSQIHTYTEAEKLLQKLAP